MFSTALHFIGAYRRHVINEYTFMLFPLFGLILAHYYISYTSMKEENRFISVVWCFPPSVNSFHGSEISHKSLRESISPLAIEVDCH